MTPEQMVALMDSARASDAWSIMDRVLGDIQENGIKGVKADADMALHYIAKVRRILAGIATEGADQ